VFGCRACRLIKSIIKERPRYLALFQIVTSLSARNPFGGSRRARGDMLARTGWCRLLPFPALPHDEATTAAFGGVAFLKEIPMDINVVSEVL
jgi:hypothetical protein